MVELNYNEKELLDLQDDFMMNEDLDLYQFIGGDPAKAFYLGSRIKGWFKDLDKKQQYLYSKQLRHNNDDLHKYSSQIQFWADKFSQTEDINVQEFTTYLLNNMFYDNDFDEIKLALLFGMKTDE